MLSIKILIWWENVRQLATASTGHYTLSFEYNDEGIRTLKTVNWVDYNYHLSNSLVIAEEWGNNLIIYLYDAEGTPIGMQYRNTSYAEGAYDTYWFEKNLQGDIVAVYSETGTKLIAYTYDAWGNFSTTYYNGGASTTATYNPFRYRGYYYDAELGFYYLNSRYYDPAIGRFINPDDVSLLGANGDFASLNLYAYCENNPVKYGDSEGNFINTITGAIIGGIVGGISAWMNGDNIGVGIAAGIGTGALAGAAADIALAIGGPVGLAIAAVGGALSNGINYGVTEHYNGREIDKEMLVVQMASGAASNMLTFALGMDGLTKIQGNTGAKSFSEIMSNVKFNASQTFKECTTAIQYALTAGSELLTTASISITGAVSATLAGMGFEN